MSINDVKNDKNPNNQVKFDGMLVVLLGLALSSFWWAFSHFIHWASENKIEYVLIPLVLGLLLIFIEVMLVPKVDFLKKAVKIQLIIGIIGQLVADWLIYSSLNSIGPEYLQLADENYQISTRWLSNDDYIMSFLGIWFLFTFMILLPAIFSLLVHAKRENEPEANFTKSWHLGLIVLGILLGIRVGSSWSMPFYHLIYSSILLPIVTLQVEKVELKEDKKLLIMFPIIPMLGLLFLGGFWFIVIEVQQVPHFSGNWLWLLLSLVHLIILLVDSYVLKGKSFMGSNPLLHAGLWIIAALSMVMLALANLFSVFTVMRTTWLVFGIIGSAFFCEMLLNFKNEQKGFLLIWVFLGLFTGLLGILMPYVINSFDPISSYATIGFALLNIMMTVPFYLKRMKKPVSKEI